MLDFEQSANSVSTAIAPHRDERTSVTDRRVVAAETSAVAPTLAVEPVPDRSSTGSEVPPLERVLAGVLLVAASPVMLVVAVLVRIRDGRPVLYAGERLGQRRRPFVMFKFRTLAPDAQSHIGGQLVDHSTKLLTSCGRFLRETRLDELPQLWNVARGEMGFLGPRPERAEVYERSCRHLPNYEQRFRVPPGLLGASQIFTPHGSPKRLRNRIDLASVGRRRGNLELPRVASLVAGAVCLRAASRAGRFVSRRVRRVVLRQPFKRRALDRHRVWGAAVFDASRPQRPTLGALRDINEEAFAFDANLPFTLDDTPRRVNLVVPAGRSVPRRLRTARVWVVALPDSDPRAPRRQGPDDTVVRVARYWAASENAQYVLDQYFLRKSLVRPRI